MHAIPSPENLSGQKTAATIVALINASPRSPRQQEIEAIIAKAVAEIARAGADIRHDGSLGEAQAQDVFERPAARLVEAVLQFGGSSAPRLGDVDFEPAINPETGKPLSFDYTNEDFGRAFLPSIRLAFCIMGRDREGVAAFVRGLTQDPDDPEAETLFKLLDNWRIVQNKFEAIAHFAQAASARVMAVGMAIDERQTEGAVP